MGSILISNGLYIKGFEQGLQMEKTLRGFDAAQTPYVKLFKYITFHTVQQMSPRGAGADHENSWVNKEAITEWPEARR